MLERTPRQHAKQVLQYHEIMVSPKVIEWSFLASESVQTASSSTLRCIALFATRHRRLFAHPTSLQNHSRSRAPLPAAHNFCLGKPQHAHIIHTIHSLLPTIPYTDHELQAFHSRCLFHGTWSWPPTNAHKCAIGPFTTTRHPHGAVGTHFAVGISAFP